MQNKCVDNGNGNGVMQTSVMHHVEKMLYNRNVNTNIYDTNLR